MTVWMAVTADRELWARAVAGEAAAFGELFERHAKRVYNFCFRQTANWAEAEDAMAEVFLVAWKRRESVELTTDDQSVLPWLLGVALSGGTVDKIDAFVGVVAERHVARTEFGELQLAIWKKHFEAVCDGDRFFYLNDPQLTTIKLLYGVDYRHTLAELIELNSGASVPADVFEAAA